MPNSSFNRYHKAKFCTGCGHASNVLNSDLICPECIRAEIIMKAQFNSKQQVPRQGRIVSSPRDDSTGNMRYEVSYVTKFGIRAVLRVNRKQEAWERFEKLQDRKAMGLTLTDTLGGRKVIAKFDGTEKI